MQGELIKSGSAVPDLSKPGLLSAGLSVVWAVVAGMGFERSFQRMRGAVGVLSEPNREQLDET